MNRLRLARAIGVVLLAIAGLMLAAEVMHALKPKSAWALYLTPVRWVHFLAYAGGGIGFVLGHRWGGLVFLAGVFMWWFYQIYGWWGWTTVDGTPVVSVSMVEVGLVAVVLPVFVYTWRVLR